MQSDTQSYKSYIHCSYNDDFNVQSSFINRRLMLLIHVINEDKLNIINTSQYIIGVGNN